MNYKKAYLKTLWREFQWRKATSLYGVKASRYGEPAHMNCSKSLLALFILSTVFVGRAGCNGELPANAYVPNSPDVSAEAIFIRSGTKRK